MMAYEDDFEGSDEEQMMVYQWWFQSKHTRQDETFKLKIDLPQFNRELEMEDLLEWLKNVDNYFKYTHTPEENKVKLVAYKFNVGALAWWDQEQDCKGPSCLNLYLLLNNRNRDLKISR